MRKAVFSLALFSSLVFGLNTAEPYPCYRYACTLGPDANGNPVPTDTFRWIEPVEVWIVSDFPPEKEKNVIRALKMWSSVSGIKFIYRGRLNLSNAQVFDENTCLPKPEVSNIKGIVFFNYPQSCNMSPLERGHTFKPIFVDPTPRPMDVQVGIVENYNDVSTFIHELGHAIGLGHPFEHGEPDSGDNPTYSIMQYSYRAIISQDDVEVTQYLYGQPTEGEPMEVFEYKAYEEAVMSRTPNGICVAGGVYPFTAVVVSGNCEVKPQMDRSVVCWEVYGDAGETCTIRVVDSQGNSAEGTIVVESFSFTGDIPVDDGGVVSESGGGGGGGCNTASELGILGLLAVLGRFLRRFLS